MKLYPDQQQGKDLLIDTVRKGFKRVGFAAPCSYGKTVLMSNLVQGSLKKGKIVWVIVDSTELIDQTLETLVKHGIEAAVIQGIHEDTDYSQPAQVCTAQTLTRRWGIFDAHPEWLPDLVLVDEFHIQHKAHRELMDMIPKTLFIGFSATPVTKGLGKVWETLVVGSTVKQLLDEERLSPIVGYACHTPSMKGVKTNARGDYAEGETEKKVNTTQLRGDLVRNWIKIAHNVKTIVFCVNVKHSIDVANEFAENGYHSIQIDGRTNKALRKNLIDEFRDSKDQILVTVGIAIKGFNVVDIGCIIDAQPTKSLSRHIQKLGRGMRLNSTYKECLVLDHGGNLLRNGFPEDFEPKELCMGKRGENADHVKPEDPLPKPCPACGIIKPIKVHKCPACGFEPERPSNVEVEDADLTIIKKKMSVADKRNRSMNNDEKQEFFSCLLKHSQDKRYKKGWAENKYREYFNVWPNKRDYYAAGYVSDTVRNFIIAGNIKYANRVKKD